MLIGTACRLFAQDRANFQNQYQLHITRATEPVRIDGHLDEAVWQRAEKATDFWLKWPRYGSVAKWQTSVRVAYDDKMLYIGFHCRDTGRTVVQSLKRDVGYWDSDGVAIILDPTNQATNGYFFATTPAGVQTEGLLGGEDDFTWDNRWYVETHNATDHWTAEFAIPLQIIRFNESNTTWGINFIRNDVGSGEWHTWTKVPFQFDGTDLGFTGQLIWDATPHRSKGNYNLSPYATAGTARDFEEGTPWKGKAAVGLDAKIGIGSALNLDITTNPDFSQIEVDEQVINLTRFDVQLPEKRTFFLENADIFGAYGIPPIRPFFSRRIGLDDNAQPVPILYGLRLTGNVDPATRIGVMNMHTRARGEQGGHNFSALSLKRRLFGRTTASLYALNKQKVGGETSQNRYSRNAGGEFYYVKENGTWGAWGAAHGSFQPNVKGKNWWNQAGVEYKSERFNGLIDFLHMGENYHADMGFEVRIENYDVARDTVIRLGYNFVYSEGEYRIMPKRKDGKLNLVSIGYENFSVINPNGTWNEQNNRLAGEFLFKNTAYVRVEANHTWANVPVSFKFDEGDNTQCVPLSAGQYAFSGTNLEVGSDSRKYLSATFSVNGGQFYNGTRQGISAGLRYRVQPWGNFRVDVQYNRLDFPVPHCDVTLFNVTPRLEFFFHRNLNWTTFLQYNTQADNFNINSRLQWRYRPMSDLFIVYSDNYVAQSRLPRNRAWVLKVNYWL